MAMADDAILKRIDAAVNRLCNDLFAIYTNFFDHSTLQESSSQKVNPRRVIATGTYACGVWRVGEDINFICISNNTTETFWSFLKESLCLDEDAKLPKGQGRQAIELSSTKLTKKTDASRCCLHEFAELSLRERVGCRFYLYYAEASTTTIERILTGSTPYPSDKPPQTNAKWNAVVVREIEAVARDVKPFASTFRSLICDIREWADFHGLIGEDFGFLSSKNIFWVAHGTCVVKKISSPMALPKTSSLRRAAINRLKSLIRSDPISTTDASERKPCQTTGEEHLGQHLTLEAKEAICKADLQIRSIVPSPFDEPQEATTCFFDDFDRFLKVECECWAPMLDVRREIQEKLVPTGLVKFTESLRSEETSLRIWPISIVHTLDQKHRVLAVGIQGSEAPHLDPEHIKYVFGYDRKVSLVRVTLATREDLEAGFRSRFVTEADIESSDSDSSPSTSIEQPTRFRTAHSAISRLIHDPKHASVNYEVGYEDRFVEGLMWLPLEDWGGKVVEDENFIPEHRVRRLRRSRDKRVVWDRANKIDLT